jgi:hypothetical protein
MARRRRTENGVGGKHAPAPGYSPILLGRVRARFLLPDSFVSLHEDA